MLIVSDVVYVNSYDDSRSSSVYESLVFVSLCIFTNTADN